MRNPFLRPLLSGCLLGLTLTFPQQALESARQALDLFATGVLPALLPFTACMLLFTAGKTVRMPVLLCLSLLGGSPAGARLFQDAALSPVQSRKIAAQTGVMSPMFFLGTLSLWLQSASAARMLWLCHLSAALLAGLFFRGDDAPAHRIALQPLTFGTAMTQSAQAMLTAGACIVLGAVASRMLFCLFPLLSPFWQAMLACLTEVTGGAKRLIALAVPLPVLSAALSFSGISILLQNAAFWGKHGVSLKDLVWMAILRSFLAFLLCFAILLCLPAQFAV